MRRRATLLLAAMAAALVVSGGAAIAAAITCVAGSTQTNPCMGTAKTSTQSGDDIITGTSGTDWIAALSGNDKITAAGGNDITSGAEGSDTYNYANSWGVDNVQDYPTTGSTDTLSFNTVSAPMNIFLTDTSGTIDVYAYNKFTGALRAGVDLTAINSSGQPVSALIENVVGGLSSDYIEDNSLKNKLTGGGGPDTIHAGKWGGLDQALGGNDNDFIVGYGTNNILSGDKGDDEIWDIGASSNDTYKYARGFGVDIAWDDGGTADVADLSAYNTSELSAQYVIDYLNGDGVLDTIVVELADGNMVALVNGYGGPGIIESLKFSDATLPYTGPPAGSQTTQQATTQEATQADETKDAKAKIQKASASKEKELKSKLPKTEDVERNKKQATQTKKDKPKAGPLAKVVEE